MRILIFEPHVGGHHGPYIDWMATGLVTSGVDVTVVTLPHSLAHPSLQAVLSRSATANTLRFIASPGHAFRDKCGQRLANLGAGQIFYWRLFRDWYRIHGATIQPDAVFLPYLDHCLYAIGLLGSPFRQCPWVGLAMRPSFHYSEMGITAPEPSLAAIKKFLFFRLLRNGSLRCLLTIDESLHAYANARTGGRGKTVFLPQPADLGVLPDGCEAKRRLGLPTDRHVILIYGAISLRKGVAELLTSLGQSVFPPSVDVLLAGELDSDVRAVLAQDWVHQLLVQDRVRVVDRFIAKEEEPVLFAAADIVWLGYRGHYTASGVLEQAASARKPVIACDEGILGWQTRRHGFGEVVSTHDPFAVIAAVNHLLDRVMSPPHRSHDTSASVCGASAKALDALVRALAVAPPASALDEPLSYTECCATKPLSTQRTDGDFSGA